MSDSERDSKRYRCKPHHGVELVTEALAEN